MGSCTSKNNVGNVVEEPHKDEVMAQLVEEEPHKGEVMAQLVEEEPQKVNMDTMNPGSWARILELVKPLNGVTCTFPHSTKFHLDDRYYIRGTHTAFNVFDVDIQGIGHTLDIDQPKRLFEVWITKDRAVLKNIQCTPRQVMDVLSIMHRLFPLDN